MRAWRTRDSMRAYKEQAIFKKFLNRSASRFQAPAGTARPHFACDSSITRGRCFRSDRIVVRHQARRSCLLDDEKSAPVRFNDRPYRGRIEVFTNLRGSLTVVNELGLEDYVRGVVANELHPAVIPPWKLSKRKPSPPAPALKNRGQFMAQGFDILPTTRSQVYRGLTSENVLSTRAVDETRGIVATFAANQSTRSTRQPAAPH